jgi:hypothetical protein
MEIDRKIAINYILKKVYNMPSMQQLNEHRLINEIMLRLGIPSNSRTSVLHIVDRIYECHDANVVYDARATMATRGRKCKILEYDEQAKIIYKTLGSGLGISNATIMLNNWRLQNNQPVIAWSTVQSFCEQSDVVSILRRQTKKSGKDDEGTAWAIARLAQCEQWRRMYNVGIAKSQITNADVTDAVSDSMLKLHAIVWWDEKHKKVILGHTSKYEVRIARNAAGDYCGVSEGGILPCKMPNTTMKYASDARGLFG